MRRACMSVLEVPVVVCGGADRKGIQASSMMDEVGLVCLPTRIGDQAVLVNARD